MFGRQSGEQATVVAFLAAQIRRDISFGDLAPDAKLKIEELRTRYGGSAHSLREALTLLSVEGLVEATAQRGFRVASATEEDLTDITRLRKEIECLGLEWSIKNADLAWEGQVIAARHALSRVEDEVMRDPVAYALEWEEYNQRFHYALIAACGSPRLLEMHERLYNQSRRFRLAALRENRVDFSKSRRAHDAIASAAIARDALAAVKELEAHIGHASGQPFATG